MTGAGGQMKGARMEEVVRAYLLSSGFFVLRGIKLVSHGDALTDIDVWTYERATNLARRRTVLDVKDRKSPQAAERLFFIKGLACIIGVEAAGVATSEVRPHLRDLAKRHSVIWLDGYDIRRLQESVINVLANRLSEEQLVKELSTVDDERKNRDLRDTVDRLKSAIVSRFGPASANVALDAVKTYAISASHAYPDSRAAKASGRIVYFSAAIAAASLDFAAADTALRPPNERVEDFVNILRLGSDAEGTLRNLRWAESAIKGLLPNGASLAKALRNGFLREVNAIEPNGFAEVLSQMTNSDTLFRVARELESAAYGTALLNFDQLSPEAKGFLGAALDFSRVERSRFAQAWTAASMGTEEPALADKKRLTREEGRLI